jgi:hypothetical protein
MANYTERYTETYDKPEEKQLESNLNSNGITIDRINGEEEKEMNEIITLQFDIDRVKRDYSEWKDLLGFLKQYNIPFNETYDNSVEDDEIAYISLDKEIYRYFCWDSCGHGAFYYNSGGTVDRFIINKEGGK